MSDRDETVAFMKRFSFATIVTAKDGLPVVTHLPFLVTVKDEHIVLTSHFAKANQQWNNLPNDYKSGLSKGVVALKYW